MVLYPFLELNRIRFKIFMTPGAMSGRIKGVPSYRFGPAAVEMGTVDTAPGIFRKVSPAPFTSPVRTLPDELRKNNIQFVQLDFLHLDRRIIKC